MWTLVGLVRVTVLAGLASFLLAIGLGWLASPRSRPRPAEASRMSAVNFHHLTETERFPRLLDRGSGRLDRLAVPQGEQLESATCSPWRDDDGSSVVVGRWIDRSGPSGTCRGFGVARFKVPGLKALDRIPLEVIPLSRPCFYPRSVSRILFTSGSGRLYRFSFEGADDPGSGCDDDSKTPRPLDWKVRPPGESVMISDPTWPSDPRMGNRIIVALTYLDSRENPRSFHPLELWWLKLGHEGTSIVAAGRLFRNDEEGPGRSRREERFPTVAVAAGHGLALAYLARIDGRPGHELRIGPIAIDRETGDPWVDARRSRPLARRCLPDPPSFSIDGRWIYGMADLGSNRASCIRCPVMGHETLTDLAYLAESDGAPVH